MNETAEQTIDPRVPARLRPYESRALTYTSSTTKLARMLLITTLVCGALAALSFAVGERSVVKWAEIQGGDDVLSRGFISFLLRMPRFFMYAVFVLFFIIGIDRKQRVWVQIALIVFVIDLVFAGILVRVLKIVIGRARPFVGRCDFRPFLLTANSYHSLPSGESADIAASTSFFLYFARTNKVRLLMFVMIAMVMFERLMVGEHHLSDVAAGAYLSFVVSFIVWHWFVVGFPFKRVRAWLRQDEPVEDIDADATQTAEQAAASDAVSAGDAAAAGDEPTGDDA